MAPRSSLNSALPIHFNTKFCLNLQKESLKDLHKKPQKIIYFKRHFQMLLTQFVHTRDVTYSRKNIVNGTQAVMSRITDSGPLVFDCIFGPSFSTTPGGRRACVYDFVRPRDRRVSPVCGLDIKRYGSGRAYLRRHVNGGEGRPFVWPPRMFSKYNIPQKVSSGSSGIFKTR